MSMAKGDVAVKRRYDSPLRRRQADDTKRAVVQAAAKLFVETGFGATSIDDIAAATGVSRATVFSVGSKAGILRQAYGWSITGDDDPTPLVERPTSRRVREARDQDEYIRRYSAMCADMYERLASIHEVLRGTSKADPEVEELLEVVESQRRRGAMTIAEDLAKLGPLRSGVTRRDAADIVSVLNDPGLYHRFVNERGWTKARFRRWLTDALRTQLLASL